MARLSKNDMQDWKGLYEMDITGIVKKDKKEKKTGNC